MHLGGGVVGDSGDDLLLPVLHPLLGAGQAKLYFPECLAFSPTSHPLSWLGYGRGLASQTEATLMTEAFPRSPQGPNWLLLGPQQGHATTPP